MPEPVKKLTLLQLIAEDIGRLADDIKALNTGRIGKINEVHYLGTLYGRLGELATKVAELEQKFLLSLAPQQSSSAVVNPKPLPNYKSQVKTP